MLEAMFKSFQNPVDEPDSESTQPFTGAHGEADGSEIVKGLDRRR